jgi:hypothetical protein
MSQPSLGKNSAPLVLLHSRSPHLRQVDHASTTVSTFRNELHPLENFNTKLPAAPRKLLQRSALSHKNFTKEKKQFARPPSPHTPTSHTHTMLLHFLRQLDCFTQTLALRSLSTWQVVVQKRKARETKTKRNRQPRRLLVSAISACMHIPACMCSHGSLSIWHGHFLCQLDLHTLPIIIFIFIFKILKFLNFYINYPIPSLF